MINAAVILPAAGLGSRFASGGQASASKIEFELAHKPVFLHAIALFRGRADVGQILMAVHPDRLDDFTFRWGDKLSFMGVKLIAGGTTDRWETVKLALDHVPDDATHIAVHDAARPCASAAMLDRVMLAAARHPAVIPGLAMGDTVKRVGDTADEPEQPDPLDAILGGPSGHTAGALPVLETLARHDLYRVQTPQVFERGLLVDCYDKLTPSNAACVTDDASVVERTGHTVLIVEGDPLNLKLTHPADAELLEAVLTMRRDKDAKARAEQALFGDDEE